MAEIQKVEKPNINFDHHPTADVPEELRKAFPSGIPHRDLESERNKNFQAHHERLQKVKSLDGLEAQYRSLARQLVERLDQNARKRGEVDGEIRKLSEARDLELRAWERLKRREKEG